MDLVARGRKVAVAAEGVPHALAFLAHVLDGEPGKRARVVGLAATCRVEGGPIERHPATLGVDVDDDAVERTELGVTEVEEIGPHRRTFWRRHVGTVTKRRPAPAAEEATWLHQWASATSSGCASSCSSRDPPAARSSA